MRRISMGIISMMPGRSTAACVVMAGALVGCDSLTGSQPLPAGTHDPSAYNTAEGAREMRNAALYAVAQAIPSYIIDAGLLTDELVSNQTGASTGVLLQSQLPPGGSLDERILPQLTSGNGTSADADFRNLQMVRASANQAIGAIAMYDTAESPARRAELHALQGYAEILLADLFCSGVPLSTLDFQKDFTYQPGSTTAQVYQNAVIQEDSASALFGGSDTLRYLAAVLKGRALLALGQYADAAQAVAAVPDGFRYQLAIEWHPASLNDNNNDDPNLLNVTATVADREGGTGLPFLSGADPRTAVVAVGALTFPAKYHQSGYTLFSIADATEARLIQAEAALQQTPGTPSPSAMVLLNALRAPYIADQSLAAIPTNGLTWSQQVDTLFRERAAWLFLTGHRQGDLRRLIRQYHQGQDQVYPIGGYGAPGAGQYGVDVTAPIPSAEFVNPLFHGCLNRDA